jgi:alanyl-tRNA synthetase
MANGCVAAIRKGCELYRQVKGTVADAQKTFNEVKTITKEVGGFLGFFTKKVEVEVPVEQPKENKHQSVIDENTVYAELATNLSKLFRLQEQLSKYIRDEEEKSKTVYDPGQNLMESALQRVLVQEQMDKLAEQVQWEMIYNSPPELGALFSKCHHMKVQITHEQDHARAKIEKKRREAKRKQDEMTSKIQDNLIYFVAVFFVFGMLAFTWWVIVLDRKVRYGW